MIKISNNHILALIAAVLAVTCVMSVCSPIRFERQQAGREQAVKERLIKIRYAEENTARQTEFTAEVSTYWLKKAIWPTRCSIYHTRRKRNST